MATCPKRGVLNAGDRPAQLQAAVQQLVEATKPFVPRVMPIAQRRTVPMSTPMPTGRGVPLAQIGLGGLPLGTAVQGGMPGLGNPGSIGGVPRGSVSSLGSNGGSAYHPATSPITHGSLGTGGTSTGFGPLPGSLDANAPVTGAALMPLITAMTAWATAATDAIHAITETISADGMSILWAVDKLIAPYTEPLRIWTPEWVPLAVIAGRIQDTRALHTPLMTGCAVEWKQGVQGEYIEVMSIDGMAVNDGKTYLYTFLYFGVG